MYRPSQRIKRAAEHESVINANYNWCTKNDPRRLREGDLKSWKSDDVANLSKLHHYVDRLEYEEESRRFEDTCCHPNPSKRPSTNASVKNLQGIIITIIIIIIINIESKRI